MHVHVQRAEALSGPVHVAASYGFTAFFEKTKGFDCNRKDWTLQTPLSWTAALAHETVVRLLLARDDVEADSKDRAGRTALSLAAGNGHTAVVQLFLDRDDI
jgi:ankyrin repeat protein